MVVTNASAAAAEDGLQLKGSGAEEDDEQEVEESAQQSTHKEGGDAPVWLSLATVEAIVGVGLSLHSAHTPHVNHLPVRGSA